MANRQFKNINEFIRSFSPNVQMVLGRIRKTIQDAAPEAGEAMRYGIPTFRLNNENLVHFSAFQKHIGFYPSPSAIIAFKKELSAYKRAKGSVQFPLDKSIPYDLVRRIVKFRIKENQQKLKKYEKYNRFE